MKKFLILFFLLLYPLSTLAENNNILQEQYAEQKRLEDAYGITFADSNYEYKPIPKELQTQYKAEIEQYINTQVPIAKKEIEKEVKKAHNIYKQYLHDKDKLNLTKEHLDKLNACLKSTNSMCTHKEIKKAHKFYKKYLLYKNSLKLKNEYLEELHVYWNNVDSVHTQIYIDLINITKKYVDIDNLIPATGFVQELDLFISSYLEKNDIKNADKIIDLYEFSSIADKKIFHLINLISDY